VSATFLTSPHAFLPVRNITLRRVWSGLATCAATHVVVIAPRRRVDSTHPCNLAHHPKRSMCIAMRPSGLADKPYGTKAYVGRSSLVRMTPPAIRGVCNPCTLLSGFPSPSTRLSTPLDSLHSPPSLTASSSDILSEELLISLRILAFAEPGVGSELEAL
jgi:hypothetical protein